MKKFGLIFCQYFVGILFIISGLIKLNDPVGTQIKLEEYFDVLHIAFLVPFALPLSVFLCVFEVVLGISLLVRYQLKWTLYALLSLIVFFTFLTFYSAYFNKVTDCGCFGDAIKLKPWESFTKDIILLVMICFLFFYDDEKTSRTGWKAGLTVGMSFLLSFGFAMHCILHLSVIDFRAYKVGVDIAKAMTLPPGAKPTIYQSFITLENVKTKETKKLNDQEYISSGIWQDTTWKYLSRSEPIMMQKGDDPKIKDFKITDAQGTDMNPSILNGSWCLITFSHTEDANPKAYEGLTKLIQSLGGKNMNLGLLTASSPNSVSQLIAQQKWSIDDYYADEKVIKTIIRSNPGIVYIKDGVVIGKWHYNDADMAQETLTLLK